MKPLLLCILLLPISYFHAFCQYDSLQPQGIYTSDFNIDNIPRSITYYMPANYGKGDSSYPLLIFLHDDKSSAKNVIKLYGNTIHEKADAANCVVMYPDALAAHWNTKINSTSHRADSVNDVSFIGIMLEFFIQQYHCDVNRIYIMGIGNGGDMCFRFHCERPGVLSALSTINASADENNVQDCRVKETIPVSDIKNESDIKAVISKGFDFLLAHTKANK